MSTIALLTCFVVSIFYVTTAKVVIVPPDSEDNASGKSSSELGGSDQFPISSNNLLPEFRRRPITTDNNNDDGNRSNNWSEINGNDLHDGLDLALTKVNQYIRESGQQSAYLPPVHSSNFLFEIFMDGGKFADLSTLRRTGDVSFRFNTDLTVNITVPVGLAKAEIAYDKYRIKLLRSVINEGRVTAEVIENSILANFKFDPINCRVILHKAVVHKALKLNVRPTGIGSFNQWVLNNAVNFFLRHTKPIVVFSGEQDLSGFEPLKRALVDIGLCSK